LIIALQKRGISSTIKGLRQELADYVLKNQHQSFNPSDPASQSFAERVRGEFVQTVDEYHKAMIQMDGAPNMMGGSIESWAFIRLNPLINLVTCWRAGPSSFKFVEVASSGNEAAEDVYMFHTPGGPGGGVPHFDWLNRYSDTEFSSSAKASRAAEKRSRKSTQAGGAPATPAARPTSRSQGTPLKSQQAEGASAAPRSTTRSQTAAMRKSPKRLSSESDSELDFEESDSDTEEEMPLKMGNSDYRSVFKGVQYDSGASDPSKQWHSMILVEGTRYFLGHFALEVEAARAYDKHASTINRPLNFPGKEVPDGSGAPGGGAPDGSGAPDGGGARRQGCFWWGSA